MLSIHIEEYFHGFSCKPLSFTLFLSSYVTDRNEFSVWNRSKTRPVTKLYFLNS